MRRTAGCPDWPVARDPARAVGLGQIVDRPVAGAVRLRRTAISSRVAPGLATLTVLPSPPTGHQPAEPVAQAPAGRRTAGAPARPGARSPQRQRRQSRPCSLLERRPRPARARGAIARAQLSTAVVADVVAPALARVSTRRRNSGRTPPKARRTAGPSSSRADQPARARGTRRRTSAARAAPLRIRRSQAAQRRAAARPAGPASVGRRAGSGRNSTREAASVVELDRGEAGRRRAAAARPAAPRSGAPGRAAPSRASGSADSSRPTSRLLALTSRPARRVDAARQRRGRDRARSSRMRPVQPGTGSRPSPCAADRHQAGADHADAAGAVGEGHVLLRRRDSARRRPRSSASLRRGRARSRPPSSCRAVVLQLRSRPAPAHGRPRPAPRPAARGRRSPARAVSRAPRSVHGGAAAHRDRLARAPGTAALPSGVR